MSNIAVTNRFRDHPAGLKYLFFAEMWERFSFYGIRAMLVFYAVSEFKFSQADAIGIYATQAVLVYATPIIGGLLADRILGDRKAILVGGVMIAIGNVCLLMSGATFFLVGLSFVVAGTGLFKANVSALLGKLYAHGDYRRDAGFTLFYMGINVGALLSPLACGIIGEQFGWRYGFALAASGMLVGLIAFIRGLPALEGHGHPPQDSPITKPTVFGLNWEQTIYVLAFLSIPIIAFMLKYNSQFNYLLPAVELGVFSYIIYLSLSMHQEERRNVLTILVLMLFYASFFALFEQIGTSINFFTQLQVDRSFMGWTIPVTWFQSINPMFIILLSPLVAQVWIWLGRIGREPYTPFKFFLGLFPASCGFLILVASTYYADANGLVAFWWLVAMYGVQALGELCISPVGLSMVTKIAPARLTGFLMGVLFLSIAWGNHLAGMLAKLSALDESAVCGQASLVTYREAFLVSAYMGLAVSAVLLVVSPLLNGVFKREVKMKGYNE